MQTRWRLLTPKVAFVAPRLFRVMRRRRRRRRKERKKRKIEVGPEGPIVSFTSKLMLLQNSFSFLQFQKSASVLKQDPNTQNIKQKHVARPNKHSFRSKVLSEKEYTSPCKRPLCKHQHGFLLLFLFARTTPRTKASPADRRCTCTKGD